MPEHGDALLVLDRMDEGFYAIDRSWHLQYLNRSAEQFWGIKRERMLGQSMLSFSNMRLNRGKVV